MDRYIVKKADIEQMDGLFKQHLLNPQAQRINKSLGDLTGITGFGFHLIEIEPGMDSTEYHVHHFEDECVYVLEGSATAIVGDEEFAIEAGDFIGYRAGGEAHMIINTGKQSLKCIVVGQRLDHDVGDYPKKKKRIYRNAGMRWDLVDLEGIEHPDGGQKK